MGITLLEGRDFRQSDEKDWGEDPKVSVAGKVGIVNRNFAEHFFKGRNVIGRKIGWGDGKDLKLDIEIVGVVDNSLYEGPREGVRRQVFIPYYGKNSVAFYVRTATGSKSPYAALRNEVRKLDACIRIEDASNAARRNPAHGSSRCDAQRGLRLPRYSSGRHRSLWCDGFRGSAAHERTSVL